MTRIPAFRLTTLSLALLSLVLVGFGILNYQQRGVFQNPDDGVSWIDTGQGVTAWMVVRGGPADRAGIHEGDQLRAINGVTSRPPRKPRRKNTGWAYGRWRHTACPAMANRTKPVWFLMLKAPKTPFATTWHSSDCFTC